MTKFIFLNNLTQPELNHIKNNSSLSLEKYEFNISEAYAGSYYESMAFSFLYAFIFVFGILANIIVIYVYLSDKSLNKHTNYFFTNLGISDVLVLGFCIPIAITDLYYRDEWLYGKFYCRSFFK